MICVNELTEQNCNNKEIISELTILLSPYAPHIAEEIWEVDRGIRVFDGDIRAYKATLSDTINKRAAKIAKKK